MAIRIITHKKISTQQNITDYLGIPTFEEIDLRTPEGVQRYKERFGCQPNSEGTNYRIRRKFQKMPSKSLEGVRFLSNIYNERDQRLFAGFLATMFGYGGIRKAAQLMKLDVKTVRKGKKELKRREESLKNGIRREGGGRKTKARSESRYEQALQEIIRDELAGDPMNEKKWVRKTLRWMKKELEKKGIEVSISTIRKTLKQCNISLRKNVKYKNTRNYPKREAQFRYLNAKKNEFLAKKSPMLSVDAKKKEFIGNFINNGSTWRDEAYKVLDHDFPSLAEGILIPFGIYDLSNNEGHIYCGTSRDTSEFAVDCICRWWVEVGQKRYPHAKELLILCDSGGSNGYRRRLWKWELQLKLADRLGLTIYICHYPPGASKYNPVEHRLFSFISINWAGEPLRSYEKALGFINSTKTETGLEVNGYLVDKEYQKGIKVSDDQMKSLNIEYDGDCPQLNYTIKPRTDLNQMR
jgi:hypothetical protein